MTIEIFLILLSIFAIITSLFTEGIKHILDSLKVNYASNIVVLIVSIVVGGGGTVLFYLFNDIAWTTINIISIFLMCAANWLGSMIGYDKIMQAIEQIMKNKNIAAADKIMKSVTEKEKENEK